VFKQVSGQTPSAFRRAAAAARPRNV
jgi:hypothetical protein